MPDNRVNPSEQETQPTGRQARGRRGPGDRLIRVEADLAQRFHGASPLAAECMLNLSRTGDLIDGLVEDIVRVHGLTLATSHVLAIIDSAGRPLSPHSLSRRLVVSRASVTGLLDALEKRSLIRRRPHPEDRRMLLIELTDEARTVLAAFRPVLHQEELRVMACLSEREQKQLLRLVGRVQVSLGELHRGVDSKESSA